MAATDVCVRRREKLMRLPAIFALGLLVLLFGCAGQGVYMMWNQHSQQRVECRKSDDSGASDLPAGYDRAMPYSCIAACARAGFEGGDPSLEGSLATTDLGSLSRLGDSDIPFLCREAEEP